MKRLSIKIRLFWGVFPKLIRRSETRAGCTPWVEKHLSAMISECWFISTEPCFRWTFFNQKIVLNCFWNSIIIIWKQKWTGPTQEGLSIEGGTKLEGKRRLYVFRRANRSMLAKQRLGVVCGAAGILYTLSRPLRGSVGRLVDHLTLFEPGVLELC